MFAQSCSSESTSSSPGPNLNTDAAMMLAKPEHEVIEVIQLHCNSQSFIQYISK